ncbi:hypothetical protein MF672_039115 [Actinomadura sp. ATCC 31491]|uniref:Uncharacterized protein n=1 Tax=Actinomadura luzonensis TaxID=2805427 RepID=A0ABT0G6P5_9ACTN|nr:hypothetical protein [Actinomadura luzonensis]MCK2219766.1 hypothetical protein [Actinomadura luzonensis]
MLTTAQRAASYLAQTGRADLTPRQARRLRRKARHQDACAAGRRAFRSAARARTREARARRALLPLSR